MDVCLRSMGGIGCVISDHDRGGAGDDGDGDGGGSGSGYLG